jgi:YHS domain-containing protein
VHSKLPWALVAMGLWSLGTGHTDGLPLAAKPASPVAKSSPEVATKAGRLKPWQPVDASFNGCSEGFCGTRGQNPRAVVQPGAKVGDYTYCLVSGAVFQIKESHFHAEVHGKTVYFCCEGCARYFKANRDGVLKLRGLPR